MQPHPPPGKGLSGGSLPLSRRWATEEGLDRFTGTHTEHRTLYYGHTYTGNPVACAVARASLRLFDEEGTLGSARRLAATLGRLLAERVAPLPGVFEIRRRGVMTGIELRRGRSPFAAELRVGRRVILAARERGVVVRPLADTVVLDPPLILSDGEAEVLVGAVAEFDQRGRGPAGLTPPRIPPPPSPLAALRLSRSHTASA